MLIKFNKPHRSECSSVEKTEVHFMPDKVSITPGREKVTALCCVQNITRGFMYVLYSAPNNIVNTDPALF